MNLDKNIFRGYDNLPSCEIFNAEVELIIKEELKIQNYSKSWCGSTGYICMLELSEILAIVK